MRSARFRAPGARCVASPASRWSKRRRRGRQDRRVLVTPDRLHPRGLAALSASRWESPSIPERSAAGGWRQPRTAGARSARGLRRKPFRLSSPLASWRRTCDPRREQLFALGARPMVRMSRTLQDVPEVSEVWVIGIPIACRGARASGLDRTAKALHSSSNIRRRERLVQYRIAVTSRDASPSARIDTRCFVSGTFRTHFSRTRVAARATLLLPRHGRVAH